MLKLTVHKAGKILRSAVDAKKGNPSEMRKSTVHLLHAHNPYLRQQCVLVYRPVAKRWHCKHQPLLGYTRTQQ